jgi:hypothetical protein
MSESTGECRGRRDADVDADADAGDRRLTDGGSSVDGESGRVRVSWDGDRPGRLCLTVVEAVAAATGREPSALPPMYPTLDVEALETLLGASSGSVVSVRFEYAGCTVVAEGDGELVVEPVD